MQPQPLTDRHPVTHEESGARLRPVPAELEVEELEPSEVHMVTDVVDPESPPEPRPTESDIPKNTRPATLAIIAALMTIAFGSYLTWYMLSPEADFGALPVESINATETNVAPSSPESASGIQRH